LNSKTLLKIWRALLVIKIKVPVVITGTDARNEAMADLASDAVELYGGILFTTLMYDDGDAGADTVWVSGHGLLDLQSSPIVYYGS
jgi:hypothetical protein